MRATDSSGFNSVLDAVSRICTILSNLQPFTQANQENESQFVNKKSE